MCCVMLMLFCIRWRNGWVRTYVADDAEANWDFVLGIFGQDSFHYLNCFGFFQ